MIVLFAIQFYCHYKLFVSDTSFYFTSCMYASKNDQELFLLSGLGRVVNFYALPSPLGVILQPIGFKISALYNQYIKAFHWKGESCRLMLSYYTVTCQLII